MNKGARVTTGPLVFGRIVPAPTGPVRGAQPPVSIFWPAARQAGKPPRNQCTRL
jgi:hypothetical protein